jgi:hypothetical protein
LLPSIICGPRAGCITTICRVGDRYLAHQPCHSKLNEPYRRETDGTGLLPRKLAGYNIPSLQNQAAQPASEPYVTGTTPVGSLTSFKSYTIEIPDEEAQVDLTPGLPRSHSTLISPTALDPYSASDQLSLPVSYTSPDLARVTSQSGTSGIERGKSSTSFSRRVVEHIVPRNALKRRPTAVRVVSVDHYHDPILTGSLRARRDNRRPPVPRSGRKGYEEDENGKVKGKGKGKVGERTPLIKRGLYRM